MGLATVVVEGEDFDFLEEAGAVVATCEVVEVLMAEIGVGREPCTSEISSVWQTPKCAAVLSISEAALARAAARPLSAAAELSEAVDLSAEPATELSHAAAPPPAAAAASAAAASTTMITGASGAGEDALVFSSVETLTLEDLGGADGATLLLQEVEAMVACGVDDDEL